MELTLKVTTQYHSPTTFSRADIRGHFVEQKEQP